MKYRYLIKLIVVFLIGSSLSIGSHMTTFASEQVYVVTSSGEETLDYDCNDTGSTTCSLREAIQQAATADQDVLITFDSSVTTVTLGNTVALDDTLVLASTTFAVTIDGENRVTISNGGDGNYQAAFQIGNSTTNSTNNIIRNLTIEGFDTGIIVYGDNNRIEHNTISGPTLYNIVTDQEDCEGQIGIALLQRSLTTSGNTIINNDISCFRKGLLGQKIKDTTISRNFIHKNTANTVIDLEDDVAACHVAGIEIQGTKHLDGGANNFISDNTITNNGFSFAMGPTTCDEGDFYAAGIILSPLDASTSAESIFISHNTIRANISFGVFFYNADKNLLNENTISFNGTAATDDASSAADDVGMGVALYCYNDIDTGGSHDNLIYHNSIHNNADDGVWVSRACENSGTPVVNNNTGNAILNNSIYENGRTGTGSGLVEDDGLGINLQANTVSSSSYTTGNTEISENDTDDADDGGNNVQNTPTITAASYNETDHTWSVSGTVDTASGAVIELYQVSCASDLSNFTVESCDADNNTDTGYGFGEGRTFLGRTALEDSHASNDWTITVAASAGFHGGLLTATLTTTSTDSESTCLIVDGIDTDNSFEGLFTGLVHVCNTSEFSANFFTETLATVFNQYVVRPTVAQGGTESYLATLTNTGNQSLTSVSIAQPFLTGIGTYQDTGCYWSINVIPTSSSSACTFSGNTLSLSDFTALAPTETLYIVFDASINSDAALGANAGFANVTVEPSVSVTPETVSFEVIAGESASCTTSDTTATSSVKINDTVPTDGAVTVAAGHTVIGSNGNGDAPLVFTWILDGETLSDHSAEVSVELTAGTHTLTHIVSDCDHQTAISNVTITVTGADTNPTSGSTTTALTFAKTISPSDNLHAGDVVTVDIQVTNPSTSTTFTALSLQDALNGLSSSIPSCFLAIDTTPTSAGTTCAVAADGHITFTLPSGGLRAGHVLRIRYLTTASGNPGTYINAVHYVSSTSASPIAATPTPASATHRIVASTQACSGSENVDASFTVNGQSVSTDTVSGSVGSYAFANASTTGDAPVVFHWFVNGDLQSESGNTLVRALSATTTVTLLKQDCNNSVASDSIQIVFASSPSPTPTPTSTNGPFSVVKSTVDGKNLYPLSAATVNYQVQVTNNDSVAHTYTFSDTIPDAFMPTATFSDVAGGTNASNARALRINAIPVASHETKTIKYTLTLVGKDDFPLDEYNLDASVKNTDDQFFAEDIDQSSISRTNNNHSNASALTGHIDNKFVSLNKAGSVVVDVGTDKAIVNGSGDDFALYLSNTASDDSDNQYEDYQVSVSQDGDTFKRVSGEGSFDIARTNYNWIRFIKIEDESSQVAPLAPGVDLDAICLFNIGVPVVNTASVLSGTTTNTAQKTIYVDVTKAFDHPLKKADCESSEAAPIIQKDARTLELLPQVPATPTPAPVVPKPNTLPKTGTQAAAIAILGATIISLSYYYLRKKKLSR